MQICEFEARIVYKASFRTVKATQRKPVSKNQNKENIKNKKSPNNAKNLRVKIIRDKLLSYFI